MRGVDVGVGGCTYVTHAAGDSVGGDKENGHAGGDVVFGLSGEAGCLVLLGEGCAGDGCQNEANGDEAGCFH